MPISPIRRALIAVYDKTGIVEFARALVDEFGIEIISTGGTAKHLKDAGIPVTMVESVTGFPEMLDGRVKTLHPHIHAGILADRDNPEHMRQLAEHGIQPIDMVVVNLYPFEKTIADPNCKFEDAIEMIDIGGPCLLRAAAKNHKHVLALHDRHWFPSTLNFLGAPHAHDVVARRQWIADQAAQVFWRVSKYDATVSSWFGTRPELGEYAFERRALHLEDMAEELRYGENPNQKAQVLGFDGAVSRLSCAPPSAGNPPLSYNNFVDADAALGLCAELTRATSELGRAKILFAPRTAKFHFADSPAPEVVALPNARFKPIRNETSTRRKLPHWQVPGAAYFVTFSSNIGPLTEPERDIVFSAVRHWDGKKLDLFAATVMPDHVHMLFEPRIVPGSKDRYNLSDIMQSIKAFSGREVSRLRGGGTRQVWLLESYDRWIRDEQEFREKWDYIANNPVKENLAAAPQEYKWWYGIESLGAYGPEIGSDEASKEDLCSTVNKVELCSTGGVPLASQCACVFIKHTNACGVGVAGASKDTSATTRDAQVNAYRTAYLGDPNAAMGGVLAVNFPVTAEFAQLVMETYDRFGKAAGAGGFFVEVWVAPSFDEEAVAIIRGTAEPTADMPIPPKKKWGENVRLLAVGDMSVEPDPKEMEYKTIAGGMLVQTPDLLGLNEDQWRVVTKRQPTESEMSDLRLAWLIAKHTKSNAISLCKDGMLIGNGAGQMSRVMSCRIATWLAKENGHAEKLAGAAAASDAFFPFRDGPDILIDAGITAIIQPGGSKRDEDTIAACNERGVAMIFTGTRHFKH